MKEVEHVLTTAAMIVHAGIGLDGGRHTVSVAETR
jgi:hypothetical protein